MLDTVKKSARFEFFKESKVYGAIAREGLEAYYSNDIPLLEECYTKLPDNKKLLGDLVDQLKGKSVYISLKKIAEGKVSDPLEEFKALTSLLTHIIIECQKDNKEYMLLTEEVLNKVNELYVRVK